MPGPKYARELTEIAATQGGYVTSADAADAGIPSMVLVLMARRGSLERVGRGVYRVLALPGGASSQYWEAVLWPRPGGGPLGVISHSSAMALHELSDLNPAKIHVTIPKSYRLRRTPPAFVQLHHEDLAERDITDRDGLPLTTVIRTLRDCERDGLRAAVDQATEEALSRGLLTANDLAAAQVAP